MIVLLDPCLPFSVRLSRPLPLSPQVKLRWMCCCYTELRAVDPASLHRVVHTTREVKSDSIIKKGDKNMSTGANDEPMYSWLQLDVKSVNQLQAKTPLLSNRCKTERLPESSAERFKRQLSKFQRGAM